MQDEIGRSERRAKQYMLFWQIQREGLLDRTVEEYREEMWAIAQYGIDAKLREAAQKEMDRFDRPECSTTVFSLRAGRRP